MSSSEEMDEAMSTPRHVRVQSNNRFRSLASKPVMCFARRLVANREHPDDCPEDRVKFYQTFSMLIRMGHSSKERPSCRRNVSQEEEMWQNEVKDLVWLELQAYHADRSPTEQDEYLCEARRGVESLLGEIARYRFERDCGGGGDDDCDGCLSMHCSTCASAQDEALRQVERLLERLEEARALWPSGKAMGGHYPQCRAAEFSDRVSALCVWYNTTKHLRLKLRILGKLLGAAGCDERFRLPYRRYIEDVLKVKGLSKSLRFLDGLHEQVLRRAEVSLRGDAGGDAGDAELVRYGARSPETIAMALPSYRPAFLFLSLVPLEVIREFLRLRLEQRPDRPSALSVRQLLRETKEGVRVAAMHRARVRRHLRTALGEPAAAEFRAPLDDFDGTLLEALRLYLHYARDWALLGHGTFAQCLLEEEWVFARDVSASVPGAPAVALSAFVDATAELLRRAAASLDERLAPPLGSDATVCRELHAVLAEERERALKTLAFARCLRKEAVASDADRLDDAVARLQEAARAAVDGVLGRFVDESPPIGRWRDLAHRSFRFGFELHKELLWFADGERARGAAFDFALLWMRFVRERCERGRGRRPRWACPGLDFVCATCEPRLTRHLSNDEFDLLRSELDACISHVVGTPDAARVHGHGHGVVAVALVQSIPSSVVFARSGSVRAPLAERVQTAAHALDLRRDDRLRAAGLIGAPTERSAAALRSDARYKRVHFQWQRGIKVGQGRFGKVYTAVNIDSGEMMAMKELALPQSRAERAAAVERAADELRALDGLVHPHLVRHYGVEVHRDEMLIFMEFCTDGTLESLVADSAAGRGLPEPLTRNFARQILEGVAALHARRVVHRDLKPANVFLTADGRLLKIGDFGSAARVRSHATAAGELRGFVGTQAYMAPEVFVRCDSDGHGRPADVWSLGCCVVEMASGRRPWPDFDQSYQIMFRVGNGGTPQIPESLGHEGRDFLASCFAYDPRDRPTAAALLNHDFVKVDSADLF